METSGVAKNIRNLSAPGSRTIMANMAHHALLDGGGNRIRYSNIDLFCPSEIDRMGETQCFPMAFKLSPTKIQWPLEDELKFRAFRQIEFLADSRGRQKCGNSTRCCAGGRCFGIVSGDSLRAA